MKRILSFGFALILAMACPLSLAYAQSSAQEILNQFANEPTVEATMDAALAYAGLGSDRMESLYSRAGAANALPRTLYYELQYQDRETSRNQHVYTYNNGDTENWESDKLTKYTDPQTTMTHKVRAQWDLSRLIYNSEQKSVVSQMVSASKQRDAMLKDLTKVYFARRKAQIEATMNPPQDITEKLKSDLALQEMTARLDAYTGGWFSEQLRKAR